MSCWRASKQLCHAGDWNGDGDFTSKDMVAAFLDGGYEQGPRPANAVPEPSGLLLFVVALAALAFRRDRC